MILISRHCTLSGQVSKNKFYGLGQGTEKEEASNMLDSKSLNGRRVLFFCSSVADHVKEFRWIEMSDPKMLNFQMKLFDFLLYSKEIDNHHH